MSTALLRIAKFADQHQDTTEDAVEELLNNKLAEAEEAGEEQTIRQIRRTLRRPRRMARLCAYVEQNAIPEFLAARDSGAIGADGEFLKWLMVWLFEEGNWKKILEFILAVFA